MMNTIKDFNEIKDDALAMDEYTYYYVFVTAGSIVSSSQCQIIIDGTNTK